MNFHLVPAILARNLHGRTLPADTKCSLAENIARTRPAGKCPGKNCSGLPRSRAHASGWYATPARPVITNPTRWRGKHGLKQCLEQLRKHLADFVEQIIAVGSLEGVDDGPVPALGPIIEGDISARQV